MPERWEREVGKLSTLVAPASTSGRIAHGPHGDGMPPVPRRGQRIVVALVAFAVFGVAAVFAAGAFRTSGSAAAGPDPTSTVVIRLDSSGGPSAALEFHGQTAHPQVGSHCWSEGGMSRCADMVLFPFYAKDFVSVPAGTPISIDGDDQLNGAAVRLGNGGDPNGPFRGSDLAAPITEMLGQPGTYVLIVSASWPQGDVEFYFPVRIVDGSDGSSPASSAVLGASLTAPSDGSPPLLTLSVHGTSMAFDAQDGRWPSVSISPRPTETFFPVVDPGATLVINTDAADVEGSLWIAASNQNLTGQSMRLDLSSGSASLPSQPGFYRLTLTETWPQGEAGFSVGITIGTPPSDWPPAPSVVTVPDVVGLTQNQAVATLTDAGFVSVSVATPAGATGGVVADQDPVAGTRIGTTTTIRLTVSLRG